MSAIPGLIIIDSAGRARDRYGRFAKAPVLAPRIVEQYRIMVFDEPRAPWRNSPDRAMGDAIRADLASWDAEKREHYLAVPVRMAMRKVEVAG